MHSKVAAAALMETQCWHFKRMRVETLSVLIPVVLDKPIRMTDTGEGAGVKSSPQHKFPMPEMALEGNGFGVEADVS